MIVMMMIIITMMIWRGRKESKSGEEADDGNFEPNNYNDADAYDLRDDHYENTDRKRYDQHLMRREEIKKNSELATEHPAFIMIDLTDKERSRCKTWVIQYIASHAPQRHCPPALEGRHWTWKRAVMTERKNKRRKRLHSGDAVSLEVACPLKLLVLQT